MKNIKAEFTQGDWDRLDAWRKLNDDTGTIVASDLVDVSEFLKTQNTSCGEIYSRLAAEISQSAVANA